MSRIGPGAIGEQWRERQHGGEVGERENGLVTVHRGLACGPYKTLIDGDLFLPQSGAARS